MPLDDLLSQYEQAREAGVELTPEQLCAGYPELLEQVRWHTRALRAMTPPGAANTAEPPLPDAAELPGRFRVLGHYARGGIGEVVRAYDTALDRIVAVKFSLRADDDRLAREAAVTARLQHPGIVPVYGVGTLSDGRACYAMRLVDGPTLQQAIDCPRRDIRALIGRLISVANTVAYAHRQGVVHRDLKPANILLGDFGETVVLDWGLANEVAPDTANAGTLAYMSPEQVRGEPSAPAADIHALGGILVAILGGRSPRGGGLSAARNNQVDWPAGPRPLVAVARRAMADRPADRYADALAFAGDLERWLDDRPVAAEPEPFVERARRWVNAHRTLAAGGAAAVVVSGLAMMVGNVVLRQRNEQLRIAKSKAEADLATARAAVARFTTKVACDARLIEADATQLRRELLDGAIGFLKDFVSRHGDRPEFAAEAADAHSQLAVAFEAIGRLPEAERHAEMATRLSADPRQQYAGHLLRARALHRLDRLVQATDAAQAALTLAPDGFARAAAHNQLGLVQFDARDFDAARASFLVARQLYESEARDAALAGLVLSNLGLLARREGRVEESELHNRLAIEATRAAALKQPKDTVLQYRLGMLSHNHSVALYDLDRFDESIAAGREADAILHRISDRFPSRIDFAMALVAAHLDLALPLLKCARAEEARSVLDRARDRVDSLRRDLPDDASVENQRILVDLRRGECSLEMRDPKAALTEFKRAADLSRQLYQSRRDPLDRYHLGFAANGRSLALAALGRFAESEAALSDAVEILEPLCRDHADELPFLLALASAYGNRASQLSRRGQLKEAIAEYDRSLAVTQPLIARGFDGHRDQRRRHHQRRADLHNATGDFLSARKDFEAALALTHEKDPLRPRYRAVVASAQARTGDFEPAVRALADLGPAPADDLTRYLCAGTLALAIAGTDDPVLRESRAREAIEHLEALRRSGWFRNRIRLQELESDTDFALLRSHPEFAALRGRIRE